MNPTTMNTPAPADETARRPLAERLEATTQAVSDAHDAHLRDAVNGVRWERRGLLGRLTRSDR